jgi:anti-sigma factor RsiW
MNCREIRNNLYPFLDGELDVEANVQVLDHVNLCEACSDIVSSERALQGLYRGQLTSVDVPGGLADRIRSALTEEDEPGRPAPVFRLWFPAVAAAITILFTLGLIANVPEPALAASPLMASLIDQYDKVATGCCPMDIETADEEEIRRLFDGRVMFSLCLHDLGKNEFARVGAKIVDCQGNGAATFHRRGDEVLSHMVARATPAELGIVPSELVEQWGPLTFARMRCTDGTFGVLAVERGEWTCLFVARMDAPEMRKIAETLLASR